jgi:glucosamine-6-phosphate deaminase
MTGPTTAAHSRFEHVPLAVFRAAQRPPGPSPARSRRSSARGRQAKRTAVLGLATGSTPLGLYAELVRMHREEGLSFANVVTFNLDEYYPIQPIAPAKLPALHAGAPVRPRRHPAGQHHVPDGSVPRRRSTRTAALRGDDPGGRRDRFPGPGDRPHRPHRLQRARKRPALRTRLVTLDPLTRRDAAGDFGGDENTPRYAITMGVRTILEARRIVLMAWGQHKAEIVRAASRGPSPRRSPPPSSRSTTRSSSWSTGRRRGR